MFLLVDIIRIFVEIFLTMAPFLLAGFCLAGVLRVLIPAEWLRSTVGKNDFRSVLLASLAGVPMPLCSCSVLPTAAAIRDAGASKGATIAFLVSTPEVGVESISLSYALLDPTMAVARPVAAFGSAMAAGLATNAVVRREVSAAPGTDPRGWAPPDQPPSSAPAARPTAPAGRTSPGPSSHAGASDSAAPSTDLFGDRPSPDLSRWQLIFDYGFRQILDHILSYFLIGLFVSALIGALVPDGLLENPALYGFPAMLLMLVIGIPMYVCDLSSTPVAAMLILKGLNPGAALVFLLAGPATNLASLAVISRLLGRRVTITYLIAVAVMSLVAGWLLDSFYAASGISPQATVGGVGEFLPAWLAWPSAIILVAMMVQSAKRVKLLHGWSEALSRFSRPWGIDLGGRTARVLGVFVLVALYAATGLSVVSPGEVGWVVTFGKVTRSVVDPGLVLHWPYPISRFEREAVEFVRSADLGFRQDNAALAIDTPTYDRRGTSAQARELTKEAEIADGDENLLAIRYSVQYSVADAYAYHFLLDDPATLVASAAESSLRRVMCEQPTDSILVNHHLRLSAKVAIRLREELASLTPGIEILRVDLLDMHAPPEVHFAFRDVASAMEDQERFIRQAESYRNRVIASGRAQAYAAQTSADAVKTTRLAKAAGEAYGFEVFADASRPVRGITRLRLQLDAVGRVLRKPRLIVPIADLPLDLWIDRGSKITRWTDLWGGASGSLGSTPGAGGGTGGTRPAGAGWPDPAGPGGNTRGAQSTSDQETWREKLQRLEGSQR